MFGGEREHCLPPSKNKKRITPLVVYKARTCEKLLLYLFMLPLKELMGGMHVHVMSLNTVDSAKKDPFCPVLTSTGGVTMVFLHEISNRKYVYLIEN